MTSYLRQTAAWILGAIVFMALVNQANRWLLRYHAGDPGAGYTVLIGGDSRMVSAVDTVWIPESRHVGMNAEPLSFTFYKMKFLARHLPGIEMIVLPFGPHNYAPYLDGMLKGDQTTEEILSKLYGFAPAREMDGMPLDFEAWVAAQARFMWTPNFHLIGDWWAAQQGTLGERSHSYTRGFQRGVSNNLSDQTFSARVERVFPDSLAGRLSVSQPPYIDSLVAWAGTQDIHLVFLSPPVHPRLAAATPPYIMEAFEQHWERLAEVPYVTLIDLFDLEMPDAYYRDWDHVNGPGADIVGQIIQERLSGG